jgi:pyruvate/2-oxoglutarate dehydrogenase complex dihydrolipoamide acyltransferase (E2) component
MTVYVVKMPKIGDLTSSCLLLTWLVSVGAEVEQGSPMAVVETDKVQAEVPSPVQGVVTELLAEENDEVAVGRPICRLESL